MIRITYEPNNRDFGRMLMSNQTQDLADQGASFGAQVARAYANGSRPRPPAEYIASIQAEAGPPIVMGRNAPRRTARVTAKYPWIEFGSGRKRNRPQGGSSPALRILGRTGARVGSAPRGGGGPT